MLAADGEYPPPFALGLGFDVVFDPRSMYSFFLFDSIPFFLSAKPCGAAVAVAARGSQWKGVCAAAVSLAGARVRLWVSAPPSSGRAMVLEPEPLWRRWPATSR